MVAISGHENLCVTDLGEVEKHLVVRIPAARQPRHRTAGGALGHCDRPRPGQVFGEQLLDLTRGEPELGVRQHPEKLPERLL